MGFAETESGESLGENVGEIEGTLVGESLGRSVGVLEGTLVGGIEGALVGFREGGIVGSRDGTLVGLVVGEIDVGALVGDALTWGVNTDLQTKQDDPTPVLFPTTNT